MRAFEIAGGSVTGRAHALAGRNNQDASCWLLREELAVAVVADGCGSGPQSEVGAQLGARLLSAALAGEVGAPKEDAGPEALLERARLRLLEQVRGLALALCGGEEGERALPSVVRRFFLFTLVGAVLTPAWTAVFVLGDGLAFVNGERFHVESEDDTPPYLAYALTGSALTDGRPDLLRFRILKVLPTGALESILLGTDGVADLERAGEVAGPLRELWELDRYFRNPFAITRRLVTLSRPLRRGPDRPMAPLLPDDTTLVVLRRRAEG